VRALHQRAAEWFAENSLVDQALQHALAAQNVSYAVDLILHNSPRAVNEGRFQAVRKWLQVLPPKRVEADPRLGLEYAIALYFLGQTEGAERAVANASRALAALAEQAALQDDFAFASLSGQLAAMRAVIALRNGELDTAKAQAQEALRLSPARAAVAHGIARWVWAVTCREEGQIEEAIHAYQEALAPMSAGRNVIGLAMAYWDLGRLNQIQGRLHAGRAILEECLKQAGEARQNNLASYGLIHIALGHLDYEHNDLASARARLTRGLEQGRRGGHIDFVRQAGLLEAKLRRAEGDLPGALDALGETLAAVQRADVPLSIADVPAWIARYQAECGHLEAAASWAENLHLRPDHNPNPTHGIELFTLVRIWMALERWDEALDLARQLEHFALSGSSIGRQIEALLLQALIEQPRDLPAALSRLEASVRLAEPEGYIRLFVDEGQSAKSLLIQFHAAGAADPRLASYVGRLLEVFPRPAATLSISTSPTRGTVALSNREREVLCMMAQLLSNPEIARRLVISPGTVKSHVSHIYDKLGVESRAEAVARAKELGII
jgi:LuxR family maltose regulon positive regulatory protein